MAATSARPAYYLTRAHFAWACTAALALHLLVLALWMMTPRTPVNEIPIRVLNIKLGDGEEVEAVAAPDTPPANTGAVERTLTQHFAEPPAPVAVHPQPQATDNPKLATAMNQVAQQFVRPQAYDYKNDYKGAGTAAAPKQNASSLGNSAATDAEAIRRYEQLVSSWYWKFHFYPEEARQQRLQSNGTVRVEYDRHGNLRAYSVERSTGYMTLDRAMLEIANRANPFPPVPDNYKPGSDVVAFTIQVKFSLDDKDAPPQPSQAAAQ